MRCNLRYHQNDNIKGTTTDLIYVWTEASENQWKEFRYQYQRFNGMPPSKETSHHPRRMREEFGISSKWATCFDLCLEWSFGRISGRSSDSSTKDATVCHHQKKHHTILEECEKSLGYHQNEPPVLIYVWNEVLEESVKGVQIAVPKMQWYSTIKKKHHAILEECEKSLGYH